MKTHRGREDRAPSGSNSHGFADDIVTLGEIMTVGVATLSREASAADDVIQSPFAHHQQHLARVSLFPGDAVEIATQLTLAQAVVVLDLLLLQQCLTVIRGSA
jgi:hypothetical protein